MKDHRVAQEGPTTPKLRPGATSDIEIVERWNQNADARSGELRGNGDPSYRALKNLVFAALADNGVTASSRILDVGCGLGYFAADAAERGFVVDAIDPSERSIEIAAEAHDRVVREGNLKFYAQTLEEFAAREPSSSYGAIIANMTLHSVSDIQGFMFAAAKLLHPDGVMIATIPNPGVYLQSRPDLDVSGIDLRVQQTLDIDFRIRNRDPHPEKIVYFHRPVRLYSVCADNAGIPLMESRVPEHVGPGRSRDIAVLEFAHSKRAHEARGRTRV